MLRNPNAVKNLKPCKKGETHNPNGRPRLDARYKEIKKLSNETIERVISDILEKPIDELKLLQKDKKTTALENLLITEIIRGSKLSGSLTGLNSLLDRILGKAKQSIDSTVTLTTPPNIQISFTDTDDQVSTDTVKDTSDIQTPINT